jgi:hypothetical protein
MFVRLAAASLFATKGCPAVNSNESVVGMHVPVKITAGLLEDTNRALKRAIACATVFTVSFIITPWNTD